MFRRRFVPKASDRPALWWLKKGCSSSTCAMLKVLSNVKAVGNDLSFKLGTTASPTLLIGEMTVGGGW